LALNVPTPWSFLKSPLHCTEYGGHLEGNISNLWKQKSYQNVKCVHLISFCSIKDVYDSMFEFKHVKRFMSWFFTHFHHHFGRHFEFLTSKFIPICFLYVNLLFLVQVYITMSMSLKKCVSSVLYPGLYEFWTPSWTPSWILAEPRQQSRVHQFIFVTYNK